MLQQAKALASEFDDQSVIFGILGVDRRNFHMLFSDLHTYTVALVQVHAHTHTHSYSHKTYTDR